MRPWRYWGIVPIVAGCFIAAQSQLPDALISATGQLYGVHADGGQLGVSSVRREKFTAKIWNGYFGQSESVLWDAPELWDAENPQFRCDAMGCVLRRKGREVSFVHRPEILAEECASSDLVIASFGQIQKLCPEPAKVIDADFVAKHGASTIYITEHGVNIETVGQLRGRRPWTKSMIGDDEPESAD
jgi:competence protein ComEC